MAGWGFKKADDIGSGRMGAAVADPPMGAAFTYRDGAVPRSRALVKSGGGGGGLGQGEGGGGGGGNEPIGCPRCLAWWWVPLGALAVAETLAFLLARK